MPEPTTKPHEPDELQEQQRAMAQLRQAEAYTINGHLRSKLKLMRDRLKRTYEDADQLPANSGEVVDDMQILARDITFTEAAKPQPAAPMTAPQTAQPKSRWPYAAALALGLGVPGTTAVVMTPTIIEALKDKPPAIVAPAQPEYAPILLPGRPQGVQ